MKRSLSAPPLLLRAALCWTLLGGAAFSVAQTLAGPPKETRFFPLSEIRRGQTGVAYTVFEGVQPEAMQVEILGVLKDSLGPGRDLILARLHGTKPEYTGVVAGMSGSPVYIDGRLAGALSYRIGQFSKEPIAGITPIEEMLEVRDTPSGPAAPNMRAETQTTQAPQMQAMETPLLFSGFSQETLDRFGDRFRNLGLTPVAGLGGADGTTPQPEPLIPGSAVSAILVRGDLSVAGTCTVTYVDPTRLLACGHPMTQNGPVSMPMTKAMVIATLPSPLNAFKIVNTTETVGSFTEDRASAIMGRFGVAARMIPVTVDVIGAEPEKKSRSFHFEVLNDRQLTPSTMLTSIYQTLQSTNAASAEQSYLLSGELQLEGQPVVTLRGMMAPNAASPGTVQAAIYVGERFIKLYENAAEQPVVTSLTLRVVAQQDRRTAVLESARTNRLEAHAGETIDVEVTLHPYQADARVLRIPVTLPARLTPGAVRLVISDGGTLDRLMNATGAIALHAVGLADAVAGLNRAHANDTIYVALLEHVPQAALETASLPEIPLSMANILEPLRGDQRLQLSGESVIEIGNIKTGYAVTGSHIVSLLIR